MQVLGQVTAETEDLRLCRPSRRQPFRCRRHHFGGVSAGAGEPAPVRMARRGRVRDWKGSRQCPLRPLPNPPAFAKGSQPSRPTCGRRIEVFLISSFRVFDAVETRVTESGLLVLGEGAAGEIVPGRSMAFHVFVDDVDAVYAKALATGGESLGEPALRRSNGVRRGCARQSVVHHAPGFSRVVPFWREFTALRLIHRASGNGPCARPCR